jgi:hypothetical protein
MGVVGAGLLACSGVALAAGATDFEAGSKASRPYAFITVSQGNVTNVRWDIKELCVDSSGPVSRGFDKGKARLNARVRKKGKLSKTIGQLDDLDFGHTTTFAGQISGNSVTLKIDDDNSPMSAPPCTGSHRFTLKRTSGFHRAPAAPREPVIDR